MVDCTPLTLWPMMTTDDENDTALGQEHTWDDLAVGSWLTVDAAGRLLYGEVIHCCVCSNGTKVYYPPYKIAGCLLLFLKWSWWISDLESFTKFSCYTVLHVHYWGVSSFQYYYAAWLPTVLTCIILWWCKASRGGSLAHSINRRGGRIELPPLTILCSQYVCII